MPGNRPSSDHPGSLWAEPAPGYASGVGFRAVANIPGLLRDGRYRVVSFSGETMGRCPWCSATVTQRLANAQGVLGNGTVLPIQEKLLICTGCQKASIQPSAVSRLIGGIGTLALSSFMAPMFGGALYFTYSFIIGSLRDDNFDLQFGAICLGGLALTAIGTWIPLRRFIDAVRPGAVRVELPVNIAP